MPEPVGIIYPPASESKLRDRIDSTAKYVAKNGETFERRILREGKPEFSFLLPDDPFNAYYKHKVREISNANLEEELKRANEPGNDVTPRKDDPQVEASHQVSNNDSQHKNDEVGFNNQIHGDTSHRDALDVGDGHAREHSDHGQDANHNQVDRDEDGPRVKPKLGEYMQEISMKLEEPPHLSFLANPASFITHSESDIIKLTARFIAIHGRQFLLQLVSEEQGNHNFDFLKPQHGQFPYMTKLIMQYALIQNPPLDILERLEQDSSGQKHVLDRIKMRAEWNKMLEVERLKMEEEEEKEKNLYSQIDWHDFVIVETIDYRDDEGGEYPPTTADQVGTRLLQQQREEDNTAHEEMEIDMDVESDEDDDGRDTPEQGAKADGEFVVPNAPSDLSNVVIRRDYDPKAVPKPAAQMMHWNYVSPITNERIIVDGIDEHVRCNTADPRYLKKKEQMLQERIKEDTVFPSGSQIHNNLKNLAERRTDIFGRDDAETEIGRRIDENEEEKRQQTVWDGHKSSLKKKKFN